MFSPLKDIIAVVTVALILLGFFDLYFYYALFGIDIYNYLETSEIIFAFSSLYIYFVILISGLGGYAVYMLIGHTIYENLPIYSRLAKKMTTIPKRIKNIISTRGFRIFLRLFLVCSTLTFSLLLAWGEFDVAMFDIPEFILLEFYVIVTVVLISSVVFLNKESKYLQSVKAKFGRSIYYAGSVILFIGFLTLKNVLKYKTIISGNPKFAIELFAENKIIKSNSFFKEDETPKYFIGATRKFYLFYKAERDTFQRRYGALQYYSKILIIPSEKVDSIKITTLRDGI